MGSQQDVLSRRLQGEHSFWDHRGCPPGRSSAWHHGGCRKHLCNESASVQARGAQARGAQARGGEGLAERGWRRGVRQQGRPGGGRIGSGEVAEGLQTWGPGEVLPTADTGPVDGRRLLGKPTPMFKGRGPRSQGPGGGAGARGPCSKATVRIQRQEGRCGLGKEGRGQTGQTQPPRPGAEGAGPRVDKPPLRCDRGLRRGGRPWGTTSGARPSPPASRLLAACPRICSPPDGRAAVGAHGAQVRAPPPRTPCRRSPATPPRGHSVGARPGVAGSC